MFDPQGGCDACSTLDDAGGVWCGVGRVWLNQCATSGKWGNYAKQRASRASLCVVTTSGGAAGEATWLTVTQSGEVRYSDGLTETNGSFTNTNDDQLPRTTQASPAQLDALQQAVASAESQQVNEEYGAGTPDQGTQHVVCGAKGIDVYAGVPNNLRC